MPALGKQLAHRRRQDVRRGVAQHLEGVGVALGQDGERDIGLERAIEIPDRAVHARRQGRARQAGTDALGDLPGGRPRRHLTHAAVGEGYLDRGAHRSSCTAGRAGGLADRRVDEVEHEPDQEQRGHDQPATELGAAGGDAIFVHAETFEEDQFLRLPAENVNLTAFGIFT